MMVPDELSNLLDLYAEDEYSFQLIKMDFTAEKPVITIAITVNADEVEHFTQYWEVVAERASFVLISVFGEDNAVAYLKPADFLHAGERIEGRPCGGGEQLHRAALQLLFQAGDSGCRQGSGFDIIDPRVIFEMDNVTG